MKTLDTLWCEHSFAETDAKLCSKVDHVILLSAAFEILMFGFQPILFRFSDHFR